MKSHNLSIYKSPVLLFLLGFSSSITQVIMLRQFLSVFYGNEFIVGYIIAIWMSLTGLGAWIGGKNEKVTSYKFVLLSVLPLLTIIILYFIKSHIFLPGVEINAWQLFVLILLSLMPYCLLSGNIFRTLSNSLNGTLKGSKIYAFETAGGVIGGLAVSIFMIIWLQPLQSLAIVFIISSIGILFYSSKKLGLFSYSAAILSTIVLISAFYCNVDLKLHQWLFPNQKVLSSQETPYGNLAITSNNGQLSVFENSSLSFTSDNTIFNEETVHYPMLQNESIQNVLLISSGLSGTVNEILKYPSVKKLNYVEPNQWILKYAQKYFAFPNDKRLKVFGDDGRKFLASDTNYYDVIILVVQAPSTIQLNRYYTKEFMSIVKKHCTENAVFCLSLNKTENYLNAENQLLHSVIFKTLQTQFKNVVIIPGEKNYFIASAKPLSLKISDLASRMKIKNAYVNSGFMNDRSISERYNQIKSQLNQKAQVNSDFKPVCTILQSAFFFSRFKIAPGIILLLVSILLILPVFRLNKIPFSVYITGFTASSLEIIIILAFQILAGLLYAATGLLFATFMLGLALGALVKNNLSLIQTQVIIALCIPVIGISLFLITKIPVNFFTLSVPFVLIFVIALLTGCQFAKALSKMDSLTTSQTSFLYGADLLGSALGAFLISTFILPEFGFVYTFILIAFINLLAIAFLIFNKRFFYNKAIRNY